MKKQIQVYIFKFLDVIKKKQFVIWFSIILLLNV